MTTTTTAELEVGDSVVARNYDGSWLPAHIVSVPAWKNGMYEIADDDRPVVLLLNITNIRPMPKNKAERAIVVKQAELPKILAQGGSGSPFIILGAMLCAIGAGVGLTFARARRIKQRIESTPIKDGVSSDEENA